MISRTSVGNSMKKDLSFLRVSLIIVGIAIQHQLAMITVILYVMVSTCKTLRDVG